MTDRRRFLALAGLAAAGLALPRSIFALATPPKIPMTVYKSPSCGCCGNWVTHVNANGFEAKVIDVEDQTRLDELKTTSGVPVALRSCHLALVGNYAIEGHVPADLITKLITDRTAGRGLAVPGMVVGSPGMETPGVPARRYDVILFQRDGTSRVYDSMAFVVVPSLPPVPVRSASMSRHLLQSPCEPRAGQPDRPVPAAPKRQD